MSTTGVCRARAPAGAPKPEHRRQLAEVAAGLDLGRRAPRYRRRARGRSRSSPGLDDVHEIARVALLEQHLAGSELHPLRRHARSPAAARRELDDLVGEREEPLVVGRDHDDTTRSPRGRGAAAARRRPGCSRGARSARRRGPAADRGPAPARWRRAVAARRTGRPGGGCIRSPESDLFEQLVGTRRGVALGHLRPTAAATCTFSRAVRLGIRLNAWNTMPTVLRR